MKHQPFFSISVPLQPLIWPRARKVFASNTAWKNFSLAKNYFRALLIIKKKSSNNLPWVFLRIFELIRKCKYWNQISLTFLRRITLRHCEKNPSFPRLWCPKKNFDTRWKITRRKKKFSIENTHVFFFFNFVTQVSYRIFIVLLIGSFAPMTTRYPVWKTCRLKKIDRASSYRKTCSLS